MENINKNSFNLIACQNIEIEIEIDYKINFYPIFIYKLKENLSQANSILFIYFLEKELIKLERIIILI